MPKSLTKSKSLSPYRKQIRKARLQYYFMTILFNLLDIHISLPWATRAETESPVIFTCILLDYGKIFFFLVFSTRKERTENYKERKFPAHQSS